MLVPRFLSNAHARVFAHFRSSATCIKTTTHKPLWLLTCLVVALHRLKQFRNLLT